jgi:hypothetical protein
MLPGWHSATRTPVRHTRRVRASLEGVIAGYGIAIPVGPITLLIFDTAQGRGSPQPSRPAPGQRRPT